MYLVSKDDEIVVKCNTLSLNEIIKEYIKHTSLFNCKNISLEDDDILNKLIKDLEDYIKEMNKNV